MNPYKRRISKATPICLLSFATVSGHAASLTKVSQSEWQGGASLPSYANMYIYLPDKRVAEPPILVASHHCQGTGTTTFNETKSTFVSQADKNGYIIIFPEATGHNCWDVGSAKALKHDGGGDTHAIAQMVRYTITKYGADASRVYAFGGSSGGMMTQALLGIYPDLFKAGVAVSGVPCGCWAAEYSGDVATSGQWSGPCAGGSVTKTAQAWGDLVRAMFPGYTGHRARVQLWHGDPDSTISFVNFGESIKEWTNVLGLSSTPTKTENSSSSTTHQIWNNTCGATVLETFAIKGAGHAVQWDLATASAFLGLDKAGGQDPESAVCPGSGGGSSVGGGGSSVGGAGAGGASTGGVPAGGTKASGGSSARASSTGGVPSIGSTNAIGGRSAARSSAGAGGTVATGGLANSGGTVVQASTVVNGSGGSLTPGGTATGNDGTVVAPGGESASPDGCSCALPGERSSVGSSGKLAGFLLGALGVLLCHRRRQVA